ncbi:MAG: amidohydrolase [Halodesulfurarchaeum sp.]
MDEYLADHLVSLRRDLHRHPEPAWCEFYTTSRIVDELDRIGVPYHLGTEALSTADRMAVPDESTLEDWRTRAGSAGANQQTLERIGNVTGVVATLDRGTGPTAALRVDIDGLEREESTAESHVPAAEGFRSEYDGTMHACGHDAHAAIGVGVLETIAESDFEGTLRVFFQPAEEVVGGGKAMAESEHLADVEYLFSLHVGLEHPTGEVVAGIDDFLAVSQFEATVTGTSVHAGGHPEAGRNAVQAMASAVSNLYGIPRHHDGITRVNVGVVGGGSAVNIIPESAFLVGEVRGETSALMSSMRDGADRVLSAAADMHGCSVEIETIGEAPSAESDAALAEIVSSSAERVESVESVVTRDSLGGSEDASYLMRAVQERGGLATYVGIGTDHPGGHHTATFDVDERSIEIGVDVLSGAIQSVAFQYPFHNPERTSS